MKVTPIRPGEMLRILAFYILVVKAVRIDLALSCYQNRDLSYVYVTYTAQLAIDCIILVLSDKTHHHALYIDCVLGS